MNKEKFIGYAISILKDKSGKTLGAKLNLNGNILLYKTIDLEKLYDKVKLSNAIITKTGVVRSKSGNLKIEVINDKPNTIEQSEILKSNRLLSKSPILLYHGSKDKIIYPEYGKGKKNNDYGQGFYLTPDKELAKVLKKIWIN